MIVLTIDEQLPSSNRGQGKKRRWSASDTEFLRARYLQYRDTGKLDELARLMGRAKTFICTKARAIGLTDLHHKHSWARMDEKEALRFIQWHTRLSDSELAAKFAISVSAVERRRVRFGLAKDPKMMWKLSQHPRGFRGGTHGPNAKLAISAASKTMWANPDHFLNSAQHRQALGDRALKLFQNGKLRGGYSRANGGRRADLGNTYFRSSWEANYARYLNWLKERGQIESWEYEVDTFVFHEIKRGTRSYTPDFKVVENGQVHYDEIKGWMDPKSIVRMKRMSKYYPDIQVRIIGAKEYRAISTSISDLIPNWERRSRSKRLRLEDSV